MVTLGVAANLPKLIRGIVLLDPPLMSRNTSIKQAASYSWFTWVSETLASKRTLEEVVVRRKELEPEVPEILAQNDAEMILGIDPESMAYILNDRSYENFELERVLPKVACPALLVRVEPELGGLVRDSDVALLEAHIPHITTIQVSGIGHAICWGPAGKTALEYVTQFLDSL